MRSLLTCLLHGLCVLAVLADNQPPNSAYAGCFRGTAEKIGQRVSVHALVYPNSTFSVRTAGFASAVCYMQRVPEVWGDALDMTKDRYPCMKSILEIPMVRSVSLQRVRGSLKALRLVVRLTALFGDVDVRLERYSDACRDPALDGLRNGKGVAGQGWDGDLADVSDDSAEDSDSALTTGPGELGASHVPVGVSVKEENLRGTVGRLVFA